MCYVKEDNIWCHFGLILVLPIVNLDNNTKTQGPVYLIFANKASFYAEFSAE